MQGGQIWSLISGIGGVATASAAFALFASTLSWRKYFFCHFEYGDLIEYSSVKAYCIYCKNYSAMLFYLFDKPKKMKKVLLSLLALTAFQPIGLAQAPSAKNKDASLAGNYYKYFTGTIAGQPVTAQIQSVNGKLSGSYEYEKYPGPLMLTYINNQAAGDSIILGEDVDEDASQKNYPIWKYTFANDRISGTWYSADRKKTYPIAMKESYPQGVMRFTYRYSDTTAAAFPGKENTPSCEIEYAYPVAAKGNAPVCWLNKKIKSLLGIDTTSSFKQGVEKAEKNYIENYLENIGPDSGEDKSSIGNWQNNTCVSVQYNAGGYVVLNADLYDYSGGAHGNPGSVHFCYDTRNIKELQLADITTADSLTVQHLLEEQFRKDNSLNSADSLTGILFDNYLPPNKNFSFDRTGIYFTYNPYEVAPYVRGIFTVFIPFDKLKGKLNEEFKKRMNIKG